MQALKLIGIFVFYAFCGIVGGVVGAGLTSMIMSVILK